MQVAQWSRKVGFLTAMIALFVSFCTAGVSCIMGSFISPCKSGHYVTIDSLYDYCEIPSPCGKKNRCEGQFARVKGYIDYGNVFDKQNYPMLPYQKFMITNYEQNKTFEVWVTSENSEKVFEKIYQQKLHDPTRPVFVEGIVEGFDMPIMGDCHRGIKLNFTEKGKITFDIN